MIWDKLETYIARKELSAKAIKEVVDVLENYQYDSNEEIESLVKVLLKLDPEVTYNFFTSKSPVITEELLKSIIEVFDVKNPAKAGRIYAAVIALAKVQYFEYANALLLKFVRANASGKLNKQLFEGFRRAIKYGNDSYLFSKLEGWSDRELNLYARLLLESAEFLNDSDFMAGVKNFCEVNDKTNLLPKENIATSKKPAVEAVKSAKAKSDGIDLSSLGLKEILTLLEQKVEAIQSEMLSKINEVEGFKSENLRLKTVEVNLKSDNERLNLHNKELIQKVFDLESNVKAQTKELEEKRMALENYISKLTNVESAFGQAGQTEIDALKGNLHKRLSPEYEKYIEIKDKKPDLIYYEILLAVLEDIFRTLRKNGITF